jgi:type VI secretion system protein ImpA
MTSPRVIDLDALLAPIEGDVPGGANPRDDTSATSLYYRIKDMRNAARTAERMAVDADATMPEEWQSVADTAIELIATQSKDLESAAWLTEALLRIEGFRGLRDSLNLIQGLVENFWDSLYPEADEDGIESKVAPVAGLNGSGSSGTLEQPIRMVPLVTSSTGAYSLWHYEQALDLERVTDPERRQARIEAGAIELETFNQAVRDTPTADLAAALEAVEECLAALKAMSEALDQAAGPDSPSIGAIRDLLSRIAGSIRHFAADKLAAAASAAAEAAATAGDGEASAEAGEGGGGGGGRMVRIEGFANREEALGALVRIASFFRKTEPHSPISYTIDDAVRRARMSLPDLLMELTQDPAHAEYILLAAGIKGATTPPTSG